VGLLGEAALKEGEYDRLLRLEMGQVLTEGLFDLRARLEDERVAKIALEDLRMNVASAADRRRIAEPGGIRRGLAELPSG
jgi:hypothetical protein